MFFAGFTFDEHCLFGLIFDPKYGKNNPGPPRTQKNNTRNEKANRNFASIILIFNLSSVFSDHFS